VLKFDGERGRAAAHTFVRRINTLRQRMREESHPDYRFAVRAKVSVLVGAAAVDKGAPAEWNGDDRGHRGALVLGVPHDLEFRTILDSVGIGVLPGAVPLSSKPEGSKPPSNFDSLLDELMRPREGEK